MSRFRSILFVAVPEADDAAALERTVQLAESHQARLTVVDLRAAEPGPATAGVSPAVLREAIAEASREVLQSYADSVGGRVELHTETLFGVGFVEVIRSVLRDQHDLVVKAAHGRGTGRRAWLGSLDMHLLRKCPVPVWIARPSSERSYRRVLAAVDVDSGHESSDGDSLNRRILEAAASQALADFAELHVVHAWQPAYEGILRTRSVFAREEDARAYVEAERERHRRSLDQLGERLPAWIGAEAHDYLEPRLHLRQGAADEVIPAAVEDLGADLLAMGTVGRTGIAGLIIGNTAETILASIDCSVLAVKPPGFRTPVEPAD